MKNNKSNRLNAFKASHKSNQTPATNLETGIPNSDVLGMQEVNQATVSKILRPQPQNELSKTGKNNLKKGKL